jgi:lipid-A-disaccharide synthase
LDEITLTWRPDEKRETVAFLPGSRRSEITRLMPLFKEVADALPGRRKVLSIPGFISDEKIAEWYGDISGFDVVRDAQHAVAQAHFAFVCSGTATLETALIGTPFVLVYKARQLDWLIGNAIVKLPYKGLANIIMDFAGKSPVHPELFQDDVTKEKLLALYETMDRSHFTEKSEELRAMLGHGSAEPLAKMLLS